MTTFGTEKDIREQLFAYGLTDTRTDQLINDSLSGTGRTQYGLRKYELTSAIKDDDFWFRLDVEKVR